MEGETYIGNPEWKETNNIVNLVEEEHEHGMSSYRIEINPEFVQECYIHDQAWDEEFKKYVARDYPYTMSPQTTRLIASASTELKKEMHNVGFDVESWIDFRKVNLTLWVFYAGL